MPIPVRPPLAMVSATFDARSVEEAIRKDLSVTLLPKDQALLSFSNWIVESPTPELLPTVVRPLLSIWNTVEVAKAEVDVDTINRGTVPPAAPARESLPDGVEVPIPTL